MRNIIFIIGLCLLFTACCEPRTEDFTGKVLYKRTEKPAKESRQYYVMLINNQGVKKEFNIERDFYTNIQNEQYLTFKKDD